MATAIAQFERERTHTGDLAVFYYSGHGGMLGEENYLLPVNYDPPYEHDLVPAHGGYPIVGIGDKFEARSAIRVLIFDACRSSPCWYPAVPKPRPSKAVSAQ